MGIDFVWEVHDEEDEPVVPPPARALHHPPGLVLRHQDDRAERRVRRSWRKWALVACLLLAVLASAWSYIAEKANRNLRLAQADLLAVVQTEAEALVQGDETLHRSLQAPTTLATVRLEGERQWLQDTTLADEADRQLLSLSWHGDQADLWVGYSADGMTYARLQGYQHADGRWLRTEVSQRRWGAARTLQTAHFRFHYHEAEAQVVGFLAQWAEALYANLDFGPQTSDLLAIELHPYLAQPLVWVGRHRMTLTSPLLVGVSPEKLRDSPAPETLAGLSLAPTAGLEVLGDNTPLDQTVIASFSYALALALANDGAGTNLHSDGVHWLIVEAAARYEVERLLPDLAQEDADAAVLRSVLNERAVLPLFALWTDGVVVALEEDCLELPSIARPWGSCYGRSGERFREALAQATSLIAFAEERAVAWHPGSAAQRFPLVSRFLAAVTASDEEVAIRHLFEDLAHDGGTVSSEPSLFYAKPEQYVEAWRAWLWEKYG